MDDGDDLEAHLEELIILLDQLEAADVPVSQEERVTHLLTNVAPEYHPETAILKNQEVLPDFDTVVEKLLAAEHDLKTKGRGASHKEEDALASNTRQTQGPRSGPRCYTCG